MVVAALDRRRTRSTWCLKRSRRHHRRRTISGRCTRGMKNCRRRWPHCPGWYTQSVVAVVAVTKGGGNRRNMCKCNPPHHSCIRARYTRSRSSCRRSNRGGRQEGKRTALDRRRTRSTWCLRRSRCRHRHRNVQVQCTLSRQSHQRPLRHCPGWHTHSHRALVHCQMQLGI